MAIPAYQSIMLPLLRLAADKQEHSIRESINRLADEFLQFRNLRHSKSSETYSQKSGAETPEEALEIAYQTLRDSLSSEILQTIKQCSPEFFERLVVDLIVKMGYGGSRKEAGQAVGRSGDEGIDGIIKEDRLGLDIIYIQAKRAVKVMNKLRTILRKEMGLAIE
jgi:restriction system protein